MLRKAVGAEALVAFDEEVVRFGLAARATHAAEGIGDDPGVLDQPGAQQRQRGKENARGIAAWRSDQGRILDLGPINFGQAVNGLSQQLGSRMVVGVEFLVNLRAFQPEIRA